MFYLVTLLLPIWVAYWDVVGKDAFLDMVRRILADDILGLTLAFGKEPLLWTFELPLYGRAFDLGLIPVDDLVEVLVQPFIKLAGHEAESSRRLNQEYRV